MTIDLAQVAAEKGIKYFLVSFVDLFGVLRAKLVPTEGIADMQKNGAGFAGFATYLDMGPADGDLMAIPDPESMIQLPWKKEVAWLASDLYLEGVAVEASPRIALKRQIAKLADKGYRMKTGVECEFFLIAQDGSNTADPLDTADKPCYDQSALMRRYDVVTEICDYMLEMDWKPYQNDHEDANGQWEMNWEFDDCLKTADRHDFFKYMAKTIAEKHGFRATFMPKPFPALTGNGCHSHVSLWDETGKKNLFEDDSDEMGLSKEAYQFLGGLIHSAEELCSLFNPTVNSYKRINAPRTTSGATWAPNSVTYGGNNRTHMIRIPGPGRFELRLMDGATNPYLCQAGILVAGLDGMNNDRDPGKRLDIDMYQDAHLVKDCKKLPLNMLDAIRLTKGSEILADGFGADVVKSYTDLKQIEWDRYAASLSQWELDNTLDC